jgi:hypothetical protein
MPGALWIGPTGNRNPGAESTVYGLVLHIQQGTEAGTEAWQRNTASATPVSSHFLAPKAGGVRQMVDTADKAWCQAAGNAHWISVECEGRAGEQLTPGQVLACAQILAWLHGVYGVPLRTADDPGAASVAAGGLIYHSAGGAAWGNHPDCPGQPIINQRPAIIAQAASITGGPAAMTDLDYGPWPRPAAVGNRPARVELDDLWGQEMGLGSPFAPGQKSARTAQLDRIEQALTDLGKLLRGQTPAAPGGDTLHAILTKAGWTPPPPA